MGITDWDCRDDKIMLSTVLPLGDLPPSAQNMMLKVGSNHRNLEIFAAGHEVASLTMEYELRGGQFVRVILHLLSPYHQDVMGRIAWRIGLALPEWSPLEEVRTMGDVLEEGLFYGFEGSRTYRAEAILQGGSDHYDEQALLLGLYMAARFDPYRAMRFVRNLESHDAADVIYTSTPPWKYMQGYPGCLRLMPAYRLSVCREVVIVKSRDLEVAVRWPGPRYSLRALGRREEVIRAMSEAVAAWQGTTAGASPEEMERFGFLQSRQMMGF